MSIIKEFKSFAMKGNVIDLAIGIIIGAAFGKIVSSFVNDILMPPIGLLIGGVDFSSFSFILKYTSEGKIAAAIFYGKFLNTLIDFLIVAFAIFMMVKTINQLKKKEEVAPTEPPKPSNQELLLAEIRDLLKSN
ncbi:MAG: large-conductance mechanosensitive channel protein MscL [Ignavibacteriales bacterium]|nr:large-conductance mechanosensitive channel protein MscL [Ignavibacteriales bacterium]